MKQSQKTVTQITITADLKRTKPWENPFMWGYVLKHTGDGSWLPRTALDPGHCVLCAHPVPGTRDSV